MANFCSNCGTSVDPSWNVCPQCGTALGGGYTSQPTPQYYTPKYTQAAQQPSSGKSHKHSALALIFANIGLFGGVVTGVGIIFGILAIIFGITGIRREEDKSMAILGIIVGAIDIIFGIIVLIFVISIISNY
ncbi:MAG: zinc-ribbon domain-containing protein [Promethearchaeota archaeon]